MDAISYIRFSTKAQGAEGRDSLRRQIALSEAYAHDHGLNLLPLSLRDLGLSGFKGHHRGGALGTLLAMVEAGRVAPGTHLLVESFDRLSREHVDEALELFMGLIRRGIVVVTLADGYAYSRESIRANWTQLIISLSIMARAHEESAIKSHRKLQSEAYKRANAGSRKVTSIGPGWLHYDRATDSFVEMPERVAVVRRIYADLIAGVGKGVIARRLNDEGVQNFGAHRHGKAETGWHASAVDKIAHWRAVLGEFQPHRNDAETAKRVPAGDPVASYFPQVIDEATFHRAQAAMRSRAIGGGGRTGETYPNLFKGVGRCAECGSAMHFINKGDTPKGGSYLVCSAAKRGTKGCANRTHFRYGAFEASVLDLVGDIDLTEPENADLANLQAEIATRAERLKVLASELTNLADKLALGDAIVAAYTAREAERRTLEGDLKTLHQSLAEASVQDGPESRQEALRRFRAEMAASDQADLYRFRASLASAIRDIVDRVLFYESGGVALYVLGGAKVYWFRDGVLRVTMDAAKTVLSHLDLLEHYTWDDPERERKLRKIAA